MKTKFKLFFFASGTIILFGATFFLWYHYLYRGDSSVEQADTKEIIDNSSKNNEENIARPEQKTEESKVLPESKTRPGGDSDSDAISNENSKKFNSDEDDAEETDDGVTVEVESDDE